MSPAIEQPQEVHLTNCQIADSTIYPECYFIILLNRITTPLYLVPLSYTFMQNTAFNLLL